jgi:hypothetical protein
MVKSTLFFPGDRPPLGHIIYNKICWKIRLMRQQIGNYPILAQSLLLPRVANKHTFSLNAPMGSIGIGVRSILGGGMRTIIPSYFLLEIME